MQWTRSALSVILSANSVASFQRNLALSQRSLIVNNSNNYKYPRFSSTTRRFMSDTNNTKDNNNNSNTVKVGLCQFKVTESKETNLQTAQRFVAQAAAQDCQLVVLPEIWNAPYATSAFADYAEDVTSESTSPTATFLQQLAQHYQIYLVGGSIPERAPDNKLYNTCLVYDPQGNRIAKHRKVHLFDVNVPGGICFQESATLSAGNSLTTFDSPLFGTVGLGICYDVRFVEFCAQYKHCNILIFPGAFNLTTGPAHWELLLRARAVDTQCFVLACSPARSQPDAAHGTNNNNNNKYPHYSAWGHSMAIAPWGNVLSEMDESEGVVVADLDLSKVEELRQAIPTRQQRRTDVY